MRTKWLKILFISIIIVFSICTIKVISLLCFSGTTAKSETVATQYEYRPEEEGLARVIVNNYKGIDSITILCAKRNNATTGFTVNTKIQFYDKSVEYYDFEIITDEASYTLTVLNDNREHKTALSKGISDKALIKLSNGGRINVNK